MPGCAVQGIVLADVMGNIGNRYEQMPSTLVLRAIVGFGPNGVVKIASVGAVNGDQGDVSEICAVS